MHTRMGNVIDELWVRGICCTRVGRGHGTGRLEYGLHCGADWNRGNCRRRRVVHGCADMWDVGVVIYALVCRALPIGEGMPELEGEIGQGRLGGRAAAAREREERVG